MPSSPKIKKEDMLKTALDIVMESGYSALNIKEVAKRLGCSTAPISWQFGGMDGLRTELIPFAEQYVEEEYYCRKEAVDELSAFELRGRGTIELALDKPMLFQFLYMGDRSQLLSAGFQLNTENNIGIYKPLADRLGITVSQATDFSMTMIIYTQGIGSLIASGIVKDTKENMFQMIHNTGITYLKGLGAKL